MLLIKNVTDWLVGILFIIFVIIIIVSGVQITASAGNAGALTSARRRIGNAIAGFVIVLLAWFAMDTLLKALVGGQAYGVWRDIQCVDQPVARIYHPTPGESRGVAHTAVGLVDEAQLAALSAPDDKVAAAAAAAGLSPEQIRNLRAIMRVESGGCRSLVSPAGALGCMQIMPQTALQYDPNLRHLSPAELRAKLRDDHRYNIALGVRIYADLYRQFNGDTRLVHAAYNGGPGANAPSRDCPGLRRFECVWDSPGCHNTGRTDCVPNRGYQETRDYVQKVERLSARLGG
jgi:hypothetical protein